MRSDRVVAVAAILIAGFGVTLFFVARPIAERTADGVTNVSQTRATAQLPIQKIHDMIVVFSQGD